MFYPIECSDRTCEVCNAAPAFPPLDEKSLLGHVMKTYETVDALVCQLRCLRAKFCVSFNLGPLTNSKRSCEISDSDHISSPKAFVTRQGYKYYWIEVNIKSSYLGIISFKNLNLDRNTINCLTHN